MDGFQIVFLEKKAKEADKQIRELARKARTEYKESLRRSFTMMQATQAFSSSGNNKDKPNKPPLPPKYVFFLSIVRFRRNILVYECKNKSFVLDLLSLCYMAFFFTI